MPHQDLPDRVEYPDDGEDLGGVGVGNFQHVLRVLDSVDIGHIVPIPQTDLATTKHKIFDWWFYQKYKRKLERQKRTKGKVMYWNEQQLLMD